jgi:hypothetical protein
MHCIDLPVKVDGGLSISVLRNKQLFKKTGDQKFTFSKSSSFVHDSCTIGPLSDLYFSTLSLLSRSAKGKKRLAIHLTGIDYNDKFVTFIAHQGLPSSLLFLPLLFITYAQPLKYFLGFPPLG